jgi:hypothetical protein
MSDLFVHLDYGDPVSMLLQNAGQVRAHFAAADDQDIHAAISWPVSVA